MDWTQENITIFKNITKNFIIEFTDRINASEPSSRPEIFSPHYTYLEIDEINENQTNTPYKEVYSLNFEIIRSYFHQYFKIDNLPEVYETLHLLGTFDINQIINPHMTKFGSFVTEYLQEIFEFEEGLTINILNFNEEHFNNKISAMISRWTEERIDILIVYPIFGVNFVGTNFTYDLIGSNKKFVIPNADDKAEFSQQLKFGSTYSTKAHSFLGWINACTAWIIGTSHIQYKDLDFKNKNKNALTIDIGLFPPSYLEEVLHLLGFPDARVKVYTKSTPYNIQDIDIEPHRTGLSWSTGSGYKTWMSDSLGFMRKSGECIINDQTSHFLKLYPALRVKSLKDPIHTLILDRFYRASTSQNYMDKTLECTIAMESLLIDGSNEVGYQLRLKVSWLIAKSFDDRIFIFNIIKDLYNIRSKIVHEGGLKLEKLVNRFGGFKNTAEISFELLRLIILKILRLSCNEFELLDRDILLSKLNETILGEGATISNSPFFDIEYSKSIEAIKNKIPEDFKQRFEKH